MKRRVGTVQDLVGEGGRMAGPLRLDHQVGGNHSPRLEPLLEIIMLLLAVESNSVK